MVYRVRVKVIGLGLGGAFSASSARGCQNFVGNPRDTNRRSRLYLLFLGVIYIPSVLYVLFLGVKYWS